MKASLRVRWPILAKSKSTFDCMLICEEVNINFSFFFSHKVIYVWFIFVHMGVCVSVCLLVCDWSIDIRMCLCVYLHVCSCLCKHIFEYLQALSCVYVKLKNWVYVYKKNFFSLHVGLSQTLISSEVDFVSWPNFQVLLRTCWGADPASFQFLGWGKITVKIWGNKNVKNMYKIHRLFQ